MVMNKAFLFIESALSQPSPGMDRLRGKGPYVGLVFSAWHDTFLSSFRCSVFHAVDSVPQQVPPEHVQGLHGCKDSHPFAFTR